jgi:hypothetical protein
MEFVSSKDVQMAGLNTELSSREDDALPALLIKVPSQTIAGFDCVVGADDAVVSLNELDDKVAEELHQQGSGTTTRDIVISIPAAAPAASAPPPPPRVVVAPAARAYDDDAHVVPYSVSLSMPASPSGFHLSQFMCADRHARVAPPDDDAHRHPVAVEGQQMVEGPHSPRLIKQTRFHSQPILNLHPSSSKNVVADDARRCDGSSTRDKRFDPFKTFSGRLERQLSNLRGRPQEPIDGVSPDSKISEEETDQVPAADRYFDALEGPELDTLRVSSKRFFFFSFRVRFDDTQVTQEASFKLDDDVWIKDLVISCRPRRCRCCRKTRSGHSCCGSRSARSVCAWA